MKIIDKIYLSPRAPRNKNVLWLDKELNLHAYLNGWKEVSAMDVTIGEAASRDVATEITDESSDENLPTVGAVKGTMKGVVYDISAAHPDGQGNPTPYADLTAALGTGGVNIPEDIHKGGMSIKFIQGTVQSSDNKYVQYRYLGTSTDNGDFINTTNWAICEDVIQISHPEYIAAKIDAENKLFEAVKKDGTKYIPGDLEVGGSIINEEIEEKIENLQNITWQGEDNKLVKFNKILNVSDIESSGDDNTIYIPMDKDAIYLGKRKIAEIKN